MILVLGCVPCSDAKAVSVPEIQTAYVSAAGATKTTLPEQHRDDECSPFCQCACCAIAYALPFIQPGTAESNREISPKLFALYAQQKPVGIAIPVWQPPQLV